MNSKRQLIKGKFYEYCGQILEYRYTNNDFAWFFNLSGDTVVLSLWDVDEFIK